MSQSDPRSTLPDAQRPRPVDRAGLHRVIFGASTGTFVEWYDYGIYGALAGTIGQVIFTSESSTARWLATFAVFSLAFFARPVGGILCGRLGDTIGRKRTLALVIIVMSTATAAMGLVPGTASIGIMAPVLFVVLRLIQGLSAGGEIAGAICFVAEHSPTSRRGRYTSYVNSAAAAGGFSGVLFGTVLNVLLSSESMQSWGWRVPFLVALPLGLVGLYVRMRLEESPVFADVARTGVLRKGAVRSLLIDRQVHRKIALSVGIGTLNSVGFYTLLAYVPLYLTEMLSLPRSMVIATTAAITAVLLVGIPVMGSISDRFGRRRTFLVGCAGFLVLTYPCFWLITQKHLAAALLGAALLALLVAIPQGITHIALAELFPTQVRWTYYATGYNISIGVFGGTAPLLMTLLSTTLGTSLGPAIYVIGAAVITAVAALYMRETAHEPLNTAAVPSPTEGRP